MGYILPKKALKRVVKSMAASGLETVGLHDLVKAIHEDSLWGQGIRAIYPVRLDVVSFFGEEEQRRTGWAQGDD